MLDHFSNDNTFKLVVVFDTKIKGQDLEGHDSHEEANTLIPHQVIASIGEITQQDICVWSPGTDVLILLLDLVSRGHLGVQTHLQL